MKERNKRDLKESYRKIWKGNENENCNTGERGNINTIWWICIVKKIMNNMKNEKQRNYESDATESDKQKCICKKKRICRREILARMFVWEREQKNEDGTSPRPLMLPTRVRTSPVSFVFQPSFPRVFFFLFFLPFRIWVAVWRERIERDRDGWIDR